MGRQQAELRRSFDAKSNRASLTIQKANNEKSKKQGMESQPQQEDATVGESLSQGDNAGKVPSENGCAFTTVPALTKNETLISVSTKTP